MDRRSIFKQLFPEHLRENDDYEIMIDALCSEMGIVADYIELFSNLGSINKTPQEFIQDLADLVAYSYLESEDADVQREVVKRIFSVYEQRGTEKSILEAASRGADPNWIGGDLTLYQGEISEENSSISYPYRHLFTHSKSLHSGGDAYADAERWREGVIIIKTSVLNDRVREAVKRVVPAGIRYYFDVTTGTSGGEEDGSYGEVSFGEYEIAEDYCIHYYMEVDLANDDRLTYSGSGQGIYSGRRVLFSYIDISVNMGVSFLATLEGPVESQIIHDINKAVPGWEDRRTYYGIPVRSENAVRSGKYSLSGTRTGEISAIAEIEPIEPSDLLYPVGLVLDKKFNDFIEFHSPEVGVRVIKD